jgi:hypothetical protein
MKQFICTRSTNSDIQKGKVIKGELFNANGKKYILLKDSFNGELPRCTFFNYNTTFDLEGDVWEWAELTPFYEEEQEEKPVGNLRDRLRDKALQANSHFLEMVDSALIDIEDYAEQGKFQKYFEPSSFGLCNSPSSYEEMDKQKEGVNVVATMLRAKGLDVTLTTAEYSVFGVIKHIIISWN